MNFGTAIKTVFTKYADFKGVAARAEYWWFVLFTVIVSAGLNALMGDPNDPNTVVSTISLIWSLGTFIPSLAVAVRRFHDAGFSGKWLLLYLVPIILTFVAAFSFVPVFAATFTGQMSQAQFADALVPIAGLLVLPIITGFAMWVFNLVVSLLPSKAAAQGNKYAA